MNAQYFVYTRNSDNDYKLVYAPNEEVCSKEDRLFFIKQARGCINIDAYGGSLNKPRWLISIRNKTLLFGFGINNSQLSTENVTDYTGTPVRGFFGMVIKIENDELSVPFDIEYFKLFYLKYISSVWYASREEFKYIGVSVESDSNQYFYLEPKAHNININTNNSKTVILGNEYSIETIIEEILYLKKDISFISGLFDKQHAYNIEYCYMNALVDGIDCREERSIVIPHPSPNPNPNPNPIIVSKKKNRINLILVFMILIIALIILVCKTCQKSQLNHQQSILGDTIQQLQPQKNSVN